MCPHHSHPHVKGLCSNSSNKVYEDDTAIIAQLVSPTFYKWLIMTYVVNDVHIYVCHSQLTIVVSQPPEEVYHLSCHNICGERKLGVKGQPHGRGPQASNPKGRQTTAGVLTQIAVVQSAQ